MEASETTRSLFQLWLDDKRSVVILSEHGSPFVNFFENEFSGGKRFVQRVREQFEYLGRSCDQASVEQPRPSFAIEAGSITHEPIGIANFQPKHGSKRIMQITEEEPDCFVDFGRTVSLGNEIGRASC